MKPADLKSPFLWKDRHVVIEDRVWYIPSQFDDFESFTFPGWHHPLIFAHNKPICIEYCSGNGAWIAERAIKFPQFNWVAVEKKFERVRKIWSKICNHQLDNLLVVNGEGFTTTQHYFPLGSVRSIYINFPDPWPKRYHAKHRLIQTPFIEQLWRILEPAGELTIVTDDKDHSNWIIKHLKSFSGFRSKFEPHHYVSEFPDYGTSFFEDLWREKGKTIHYHVYHKV